MNYITWLKSKRKAKRSARLKAKRDDYAYWYTLVEAEEKSYAEGFQKGLQEGFQEIHQQGFQEGIEQVRSGILKHIFETGNLTIAELAGMTGLDEPYIRELLK